MFKHEIMKKIQLGLLITVLILSGITLIILPKPVNAGALGQSSYSTPTPNADGQIIYEVQEGDNCTRVFLLTGVPIDQIIALNGLEADCNIFPGQQLILGTVEPATPTPEGPTPTPTQGPPTPTPFDGNGTVCIVLYEDSDGNQKRSEDEFYLAGGVISINNRSGTYSETRDTVGGDPALVEPVCFEQVPEGEYNLSMGIPEGYNPTTSMNYALTVTAGDTIVVDFGAQPGSQINATEDVPNNGQGGGRSPLLLAVGLFMLAGGAALAFFFMRSRQEL
jgi:hypothetical protein